jgi:hypothetical protein
MRAEEIRRNRGEKLEFVRRLPEDRNEYLRDHPRAKVETAMKKVDSKIGKLKMKAWIFVESVERKLELRIDQDALDELSELDGFYVIKSDLDASIKRKRYTVVTKTYIRWSGHFGQVIKSLFRCSPGMFSERKVRGVGHWL